MNRLQELSLVTGALVAVAACLFAIFNYISTATLAPWMGLLLFLIVSVLIISGYIVMLIVFVVLALPLVPKLFRSRNRANGESANNDHLPH